MPDMGAERMINGHAAGTMPPEYVGGLGTEGGDQLKQFVDAGGTLVTLDSSSELAMNLLGAPLRDVTRGLSPNEYFCPGSIVKITLESDPLTYGAAARDRGLLQLQHRLRDRRATAADAGAATARIVARYANSNVLMSGWLEGEKAIAGKGAMVEVKSGQGRAVLFGFRPQHRGQAHATFRLFFNAIHTVEVAQKLSAADVAPLARAGICAPRAKRGLTHFPRAFASFAPGRARLQLAPGHGLACPTRMRPSSCATSHGASRALTHSIAARC